nr:MAG TPA: hypothetical protein [Caudoviricetes sp.]
MVEGYNEYRRRFFTPFRMTWVRNDNFKVTDMIFNKKGDGAAELHRLTGLYYAANSFDVIATEIEFATREVASLVGEGVVARAERHYLSEEYNPDGGTTEDLLVRRVQLPIACLAVARHAGQTLVSHEDAGRKAKRDDNETLPWEWMIDRDDRALREKYCRALDALYAFLEGNDFEEWNGSPMRKLREECIVKSLGDFETVYPIDHSYYTYFLLLPLIVECQQLTVRPAVGEKWEELVSGNGTGDSSHSATAAVRNDMGAFGMTGGDSSSLRSLGMTESRNGNEGLLRLAVRVAVLLSVATAVERWSLEVFPLSIARRFNPTYQGNRASDKASTAEMEWAVGKLRQQADEALNELLSAVNGGGNPYDGFPLLPGNDRRNKFFNAG